jgi:hypothetical protein
MYALVGVSEIDASRGEEATKILTNGIVPGISGAPGFVSATFVRSADGTSGRSMVVFENEVDAKSVAATAGDLMPADAPIKIISIEVYAVVATA